MEKNLVSIVIPVYNVETYLCDCINSVLDQTYGNLEVILIDDGSTDRSGAICDEYELKDDRISVYHKKNGGLSDARNYGIERCNGEYLYLLDSDDYINSKTIEGMIHFAIKYDADMVVGGFCRVDDRGVFLKVEEGMIEGVLEGKKIKDYFYNSFSNRVQMITACNKLYRLSDVKKVLYYPTGKIHEDEFVSHHLWSEVKRVIMIKKPLYMYRMRDKSIMNNNTDFIHPDAVEAYFDRLKFIIDHENGFADQTFSRFAESLFYCMKNKRTKKYEVYNTQIDAIFRNYRRECISTFIVLKSLRKKLAAIWLAVCPWLYGLGRRLRIY